MRSLIRHVVCMVLAIAFMATAVQAQTGKIEGVVTDAESGTPLPGVNVVVDGTTQGASSDADGYYAILNVPPGTHTLVASFVGFETQQIQNVRVNIDLTTTVDIQMREGAVGLEEVVVRAREPVVKRDVSASMANINSEEIENLPTTSLDEVIGLQAGVRGLSVRGSGASSLQFQVDGASTFDGRANRPFTGVSYTSIQEVQVQTGGFSAEYGNVRSGLVNVVTKSAPRDRYMVDVLARYTPPQKRYFSDLDPGHPDYYHMRPFLDPEVAFDGTDNWDRYLRRQYPTWDGWMEWAENAQDDPESQILVQGQSWDDLTTQQQRQSAELWQDVFQWYRRKDFDVNTPNYTVDGTVGGPVPGIGSALGNLRFVGSYRQTQAAYIIPQNRDAYRDRLGRLKLTSDIASGLRIDLHGMRATERGLNQDRQGEPRMFTGSGSNIIQNTLKHVWGYEGQIYANDFWSPMDVDRTLVGGEITHTLNPSTFQKLQVNRMYADYHTYRTRERDMETVVNQIGNLEFDEAPFGWGPYDLNDVTPTGMRLGGVWQEGHDTSYVATWDAEYALTSQVHRYVQLKTGADFSYSRHKRDRDFWTLNTRTERENWKRSALNGAGFAQGKLEFQGLIANVGLRLDYYKGAGDWFNLSNPYDERLGEATSRDDLWNQVGGESIETQLTLSPRLGISFPVTQYSKFFFNYGHFRERLEAGRVFAVNRAAGTTFNITGLGNPNHPMPRTIAYEAGYEHSLFEQYLLRLAGYYKDVSQQPRNVGFTNASGDISYTMPLPYNYQDVRGFELTLTKTRGWFRGFVNYTFMATKSGNFGYGTYHQNPVQRMEYQLEYRNRQNTPVPRPYARMHLEFLAPGNFGPEVGGVNPLGDWRLSFLGRWDAGNVQTWCGAGGSCPEGIRNNVRWKDYYMLDLRLARTFNAGGTQAQLFMDVENVFNVRHLFTSSGGASRGGFMALDDDFQYYMESLHLPDDTFEDIENDPYVFVPGSDRPGEFRHPDVDFVPIEAVVTLPDEGMIRTHGEGPLYWEQESGSYFVWNGNSFESADPSFVDRVLDDKAYIDMPNLNAFWFLNPRRVLFGLRLSL